MDTATEVTSKGSGGFFSPIYAIFGVLTDEVIPAFQSFWYSLIKLWNLLETFLATWVGEPLLRLMGQDIYTQVNDATSNIIEGGSNSFWDFFLK